MAASENASILPEGRLPPDWLSRQHKRGRPRKVVRPARTVPSNLRQSYGIRAAESAAANWLGACLRDVRSQTRCSDKAAAARRFGMYFAVELFCRSFTRVGHAYGRDRTTVRHACRRAAQLNRSGESAFMIMALEAGLRLWSARFAARIVEEQAQNDAGQP
ncbi:Chromosomal replication initiator, DnaA C-terminal [Rhabdaerophilaceae bacterium]